MKNRRKQNFEGEANNNNWIKKILDEATRIVNVFLISWLLCLFLLCSISLLVKYDFILRYEAWVNALRASSFIENFLKSAQNQSLSSEICSGNRLFFQRNWPRKFPRNRPFFPRICPWKSCEIWLFFRDLPEALILQVHHVYSKNFKQSTVEQLQLKMTWECFIKWNMLFTF